MCDEGRVHAPEPTLRSTPSISVIMSGTDRSSTHRITPVMPRGLKRPSPRLSSAIRPGVGRWDGRVGPAYAALSVPAREPSLPVLQFSRVIA